ncbi:hypothetical protein ASG84_19680 [Rhodococcus sp. Leaf278]|uniref:hypothetical protein n=1 Tax=Rhodococcus sp. Leaf278 TaxID=1736319 RepID=UPI00070C529A|nr:hypothetical protein [Rhodococcus sp. Leaf278]KQU56403.1 hypothetical protein ASG84_19680 [Rhodococcus sp. Leaf278]
MASRSVRSGRQGLLELEFRERTWRLWGASTIDQWLPLDVMRPKKDTAVVLTIRRISPVFTPDDPELVARLIRERMTAPTSRAQA